jgi:hypothetical protein
MRRWGAYNDALEIAVRKQILLTEYTRKLMKSQVLLKLRQVTRFNKN